jgi:hypothetical protein
LFCRTLQRINKQRKKNWFHSNKKRIPKYHVAEQVLLLHLQQAGSNTRNTLRQQRRAILDALQGYYQVPLDDKSSYLTTFLLPLGRYRFLRAPMGIKNLSDVFCHRTDDIFAAVPDILKIVDDALLQAPSE